MFSNPLTARLADFVRRIGIDVQSVTLSEPGFLPGLDVRHGMLLIDEERLEHPGDILHEAGHIAVTDPVARTQPTISPKGGDENAAIAWSYAAACHLGLDPAIVFHRDGYRGWGSAFVSNFTTGHYVGVPLLQLYDMALEPRLAKVRGVDPYPHMLCWLRRH
jgi:hypothetical protein